jgi:hypothetical protein
MADYIFNVYLYTDRGEFSTDYSLTEYNFNLPSFYFTQNEFVSPKADIEIGNSILSCRGANIYNALATLGGLSTEETLAVLSTYNTPTGITMTMTSKALVPGSSVKYPSITDTVWVICYGIINFD